jgi:prevent-host-death family protein
MATVDIDEADTNLSALLQRVEAGEEIVIARSGEPVAQLVRVPPPHQPREPRTPGWWNGKIVVHDSFFDPLPEDELKEWEGR